MDPESSRRPFQYSLWLLFVVTAATAVQLGFVFGSPLLVGTILAECVLGLLFVCGCLVVWDELRLPGRSPFNLAIAAWLMVCSLSVAVYLLFVGVSGVLAGAPAAP